VHAIRLPAKFEVEFFFGGHPPFSNKNFAFGQFTGGEVEVVFQNKLQSRSFFVRGRSFAYENFNSSINISLEGRRPHMLHVE
jgi:hypothetical protein